MGAGASNTQKTGNQNVDRTVQKMAVVGALRASMDAGKVVKPQRHTEKEDIYEFVRRQKEAREETRQALEAEVGGSKPLSVLPEDFDASQDTVETHKKLYGADIQLEKDKVTKNYCGLCGRPAQVTVDGWPCRVCAQTYHKTCINQCQRYSKQEKAMFDRAKTHTGWSCEHCDNILNLLESTEVDKLASTFEQFDKNKDSSVSLAEYLTFREHTWQREEGCAMPQEEHTFQKIQFRLLDADGSGEVDYWEFVKHEACKVLATRFKEELVKLLTPYEKLSAKNVYDMLDVDKNGVITESEARVAFRSWYQLVAKAARTQKGSERSLKSDSSSEEKTNILLDGDEDGDRVLTWREFLRSQALIILSSRPNKVNLK